MSVRKVRYLALEVPNRSGQAERVLGALAKARVNLLAFTGFPSRAGRSQIDLVTEDLAGVRRVAKREGWRLRAPKRGFLVQGRDRVGAVHQHLRRLAGAGVNVTAVDAAAAGGRRFGMILWVKPADYARAARALRAR
jgi:hypothetical protein